MFRQLEALNEQESRKLSERQARDRARVQRFMNAHSWTIGVDQEALAAQLEEKRRIQELEKEAARLEGASQSSPAQSRPDRRTINATENSFKSSPLQQPNVQPGSTACWTRTRPRSGARARLCCGP